MKYRSRKTVDAVQWWKLGDYGLVRYVEPTNWATGFWCICVGASKDCGRLLEEVHPGDWIITNADGTHEVVKAADFEREYEAVAKTPNNQAWGYTPDDGSRED